MIIVTGGAGFIGSNLVRGLNEHGYQEILIVDNLEDNQKKNKNLKNLKYSDYLNKKNFLKLVLNDSVKKNIKHVFHLGACSSTTNFNKDYMLENNYQYSKILLDWCQNNSVPFIYASSASIYGNTRSDSKEDDLFKPMNPYAYSKMLFDKFVLKNLNKFTSQVTGLRYFNVYGPNENHKTNMSSPLLTFRNQLTKTEFIKIFDGYSGFKKGEHSRDFVSVKDCVLVNLFFLNRSISGIYNVGSGNSYSFNFVAETIIDFYKRGNIKYIQFPDILKKSYQTYTKADISKLRGCGYNVDFINLKNGIHEYMNYLDSLPE